MCTVVNTLDMMYALCEFNDFNRIYLDILDEVSENYSFKKKVDVFRQK